MEQVEDKNKLIIRKTGFQSQIKSISDIQVPSQLEWLDIRELDKIDLNGIQNICSTIKVLILSQLQLDCMKYLENMVDVPQLVELYLSYNSITRLQGIKYLTGLKHLGLHKNKLWNPLDLRELQNMHRLERLMIENNPWSTHPYIYGCIAQYIAPETLGICVFQENLPQVTLSETYQDQYEHVRLNMAVVENLKNHLPNRIHLNKLATHHIHKVAVIIHEYTKLERVINMLLVSLEHGL